MSKILTMARADLRIAFSERATWFTVILMPIIFTAVLASAGGASTSTTRAALLIVNEDGGPAASEIEAALSNSTNVQLAVAAEGAALPTTRDEALASLEQYGRVLVLPVGLSQAVEEGDRVAIELHLGENHDPERTRVVQQELKAILARAGSERQGAIEITDAAEARVPFDSEAERLAFQAAALERLQARGTTGSVTIVAEEATRQSETSITPRGAEQSSPGQLVTFALITLLGLSQVLVSERQMGTLRRLLTSPLSRATLLAGKTLGTLALGLLQMSLLIVVGQFVFGIEWGRSPLALLMLVLSFAMAAVGIGIFLATIARSSEQASQMTVGTSMLMGAIGGAWWPLEIVQEPLRTIANFFPTTWAMDGFQDIILRGASAVDILPNVGALCLFAAIFFALGISRLRFE